MGAAPLSASLYFRFLSVMPQTNRQTDSNRASFNQLRINNRRLMAPRARLSIGSPPVIELVAARFTPPAQNSAPERGTCSNSLTEHFRTGCLQPARVCTTRRKTKEPPHKQETRACEYGECCLCLPEPLASCSNPLCRSDGGGRQSLWPCRALVYMSLIIEGRMRARTCQTLVGWLVDWLACEVASAAAATLPICLASRQGDGREQLAAT